MNELFYKDVYLKEFDAQVVSCVKTDKGYQVILSDTAFYPEGGGQPADHGYLNGVRVYDVRRKDGVIVHYVDKELSGTVHGVIDWDRRFDHMQQHSGEHVFSGIVHKHFGYENIGFHMSDDLITLDFSGLMSDEEVKMVEREANEAIWANYPVIETFPTAEELKTLDFRSKKELSGEVRIITIPNCDTCACCGTHVRSIGEVGLIKVVTSTVKRDNSRIQILCGKRAFDHVMKTYDENKNISRLLSSRVEETSVAVERLMNEVNEKKVRMNHFVNEYFNMKMAEVKEKVDLYMVFEEGVEVMELRRFATNMCESGKAKVCAGFSDNGHGYNYVAISNEVDMKAFTKEINSTLGGKGGDSKEMLQGSLGAEKEVIEELFNKLFKN